MKIKNYSRKVDLQILNTYNGAFMVEIIAYDFETKTYNKYINFGSRTEETYKKAIKETVEDNPNNEIKAIRFFRWSYDKRSYIQKKTFHIKRGYNK